MSTDDTPNVIYVRSIRIRSPPSLHVKGGNEVVIPLFVFAIDAPRAGVRSTIIAIRSAHLAYHAPCFLAATRDHTEALAVNWVEERERERERESSVAGCQPTNASQQLRDGVRGTHGVKKVRHLSLRIEVHVRPLTCRYSDRS
eukprot:SAG31_NODE_11193_length_1056_cov_1.226750_1_plen_142_part_01